MFLLVLTVIPIFYDAVIGAFQLSFFTNRFLVSFTHMTNAKQAESDLFHQVHAEEKRVAESTFRQFQPPFTFKADFVGGGEMGQQLIDRHLVIV